MKYSFIFMIIFLLLINCNSKNTKVKAKIIAYETDKLSTMWVLLTQGKDSGLICKINMGRWMEPKPDILGKQIIVKYYITSTDEIHGTYLGTRNYYTHKSALKQYNFISLKNFENLNN